MTGRSPRRRPRRRPCGRGRLGRALFSAPRAARALFSAQRAARALAAALVVASASVPTGAGSPAAAQGRPRLSLTAQSAFVPPGGQFLVVLRIDRTNLAPSSELALTIFQPVQTRSEFSETVGDRISSSPLAVLPPIPLGSLAADPNGDATVRVQLRDPNQPAEAGRVDLRGQTGVFPVRVELRGRTGTPLDRFTTHLVHFATPPSGPKLGLSLVLPLTAPIGLPVDGPRQLPALEEVAAAAAALDGARSLPFALSVSPDLLATLPTLNEDRAARTLDALRRVAADHPVVASPYVPVSLPGLMAADLREEIGRQLDRGDAVVNDVLRMPPDRRSWLAVEPLDGETVDELARRGVEQVVAAEPVLEPVPDQSLTLTRPFVLAGNGSEVAAVEIDGGLTSHFTASPNQVLQAHHLLADLAVVWLDAPGDDRRAVVAMPPRDWKPNRPFLEALSSGLAQSPVADPIPLATMFSSVEPALERRGVPLVREPAAVPAPAAAFGDVVSELRQTRRRLASLESVMGGVSANVLLEDRLLVAQSIDLRTTRQRLAYLSAVETGIADQLEAIEMPEGRSITLTDRRGQIPVTFQNRTGTPAHVVVTVQSDKLEFPEGDSRTLELNRRNTTERFTVVARTSGAFPLRITLVSPDGNLVVGRARLTVRSTAASRVSVFVSAGAAGFLALWWGQHVVRGRRARRLVPS